MFRQVKSPAYGTGIATNLVSNEERQKYNYGGRVGFADRGYAKPPWFDETWVIDPGLAYPAGVEPTKIKDWYQNIPKNVFGNEIPSQEYEKIYGEESPHGVAPEKTYEYRSTTPNEPDYLYKGPGEDQDIIERSVVEEIEPDADLVKKARESGFDSVESYQAALESGEFGQDVDQGTSKFTIKRLQKEMAAKDAAQTGDITKQVAKQMDTENLDTFNIEDIVKKYYDPKKTLGEAQLGLAGQVLKAGFQKKSDAMATLGDAVGKFGTDIAADEKAMKKLAASGEISKEVYEASQREKGKWAIKLAEEKERLLQERPDKEMTLKEEFDFFKNTTKDYHKAVDMIFGDDIVNIPSNIDINTMKKVPGKIYKIKIGANLVYKMYDDNGQEIPDFDIEEYIEQVS